jgi:hypothetical protein
MRPFVAFHRIFNLLLFMRFVGVFLVEFSKKSFVSENIPSLWDVL